MQVKNLKAFEKNPRKITERSKELLEKTMDEFGDLSGIIFNEESGNLIGGHQRKLVLPEDAEVIIENKYNPPTSKGTTADGYILFKGEKFKYRQVKWEKNKELAANIAANKGAGTWDYPLLENLFLELDHDNFDLELTGFDNSEIEHLMGNWDSDLEAIEKLKETTDGLPATIKITCPQELKDEVLIFIKSKLLETSFEGVHVE